MSPANASPALCRLGSCPCCRLPARVVRAWLAKHKIAEKDVERGRAIWPEKSGRLVALSHFRIEEMIAEKDPTYWAYLNLVERENVMDDEGNIAIAAGSPWALFPAQARLARLSGDLIVECASEVGKTRDAVIQSLWNMDRPDGVDSVLYAAFNEITVQQFWTELEFQLERNTLIGRGVVSERVKPYHEKVFGNGRRINALLCGHDGKQLRAGHYQAILADEVALWKNPQQWNELWRAGKPGSEKRIYSTPDGDYSSPFYALCQRAELAGERSSPKRARKPANANEPNFRKVNITKMDLPAPMWTEARAASFRDQYGGESSVGWITNVLGQWGSPSYSVFPMDSLMPNLKGGADLPFYRVVAATVDRKRSEIRVNAARLSADIGTEDGVRQEEMLARDRMPYSSGTDLARAVDRFWPSETRGWSSPVLFCGADLGSAQDPSEFIFVQVLGDVWRDVFRLHMRSADHLDQADVIAHLDHASGHLVKYSLDAGSFGSLLVSVLTQTERYLSCPVCRVPVYFSERLTGRGFGNFVDVVDIKTGEPIGNPDSLDADGEARPRRASNKEFGTQILERKVQARELQIAWDGGAGDPKLSGPQLLVNHTSVGITTRGERRFRGEDDHHIDARRQAALAIVGELRGEELVAATPENVVAIGGRRPTFAAEVAPLASVFGGSSRLFSSGGGF